MYRRGMTSYIGTA